MTITKPRSRSIRLDVVLVLGVALAVTLQDASAQTLRVSTDKPEYAYGEPVRVLASLINTTPDTLVFYVSTNGPPCYGAFEVDGFTNWTHSCLDIRLHRLPPRARIEWTRIIEPVKAGLPERGTTHSVRVRFGGEGTPVPFRVEDSTRFTAPPYRGGTIYLRYRASDSLRVQRIRDSLMAQPSRVYVSQSGQIDERWVVEGTLVDTLVSRLSKTGSFLFVESQRMLGFEPERVVGIALSPHVYPDVFEIAPNPFQGRTKLTISPSVSGRVVVELFDPTGRRLTVLYDGSVAAGHRVDLDVTGALLAPGTYAVRVNTSSGSQLRLITRAK